MSTSCAQGVGSFFCVRARSASGGRGGRLRPDIAADSPAVLFSTTQPPFRRTPGGFNRLLLEPAPCCARVTTTRQGTSLAQFCKSRNSWSNSRKTPLLFLILGYVVRRMFYDVIISCRAHAMKIPTSRETSVLAEVNQNQMSRCMPGVC